MKNKSQPSRRMEFSPLASVQSATRNVKAHDLGAIIESVRRFGFADAVVIDERTGRLVSGHGRIDALRAMKADGAPPPAGVQVDGDEWLVPVQRGWASRNDAEAEAFIVAANRLVELGGWDQPGLEAVLADLAKQGALAGTGYDADDVDRMLAEAAARDLDPKVDRDEIPPQPPPRSALGDVWLLGRHRLMCGDSTKVEDVTKLLDGAKPHLMVTDPPYGVEYDPSWRGPSGAQGRVLNDDRADWTEAWRLFTGEVAYVWHAGVGSPVVAMSLTSVGFALRALIVWNKSTLVFGRGHYHHKHEPLWYAVRKGGTGHWQGSRTETTVWDIDKPTASDTGHSTQKPVECMKRPMLNNSEPGDAVYDPFCGSGSSLIAAEESGRVLLAMELNPAYVDLAVARWEAFTGKTATRL